MTEYSNHRRALLKRLSVAGIGLSSGLHLSAAFAESLPLSQEKVKVVIAGCGLAGLATAHRLRQQLPQATITIIDAKKEHNYQPGYTLIATGVWKDTKAVKYQNADYIPKGVNWIKEAVGEFDPDANTVTTASGKKIAYDFLVVATGLRLGYEKIEGLDMKAFGQKGLGSVYASPEIAQKTWQAMDGYRQKGGRAVMTLAPTFIKCAGAPPENDLYASR